MSIFCFPITKIQRFSMHDGPGLRTTVFLKGCPLRCAWCHNPETQSFEQQIEFDPSRCIRCGVCVRGCPTNAHFIRDVHLFERGKCTLCGFCVHACPAAALQFDCTYKTAEEIVSCAERDRAFYGRTGGITLSGGEPFFHGEYTVDLLKRCREKGLNTVAETCGFMPGDVLDEAVPYTDLFLWDVKDTNAQRHLKYTGVDPEQIKENLFRADAKGGRTQLRCILVQGINTDETHYRAVAQIAASLHHCLGVQWLRYHPYGGAKAVLLGRPDNGHTEWIPSEEEYRKACACIEEKGIKVIQ